MTSSFVNRNTTSTVESETLLSDSNDEDHNCIYHEMEIDENPRATTQAGTSCVPQGQTGSTKYILAAIVASLGGVLFGYDLGIISGALLQLKTEFDLDCRQQEMVVSSMLFGALLGSLAGGYIIDYFGRRKTIIVNALVFFAGALVLAFAPSYAWLIIGRLVVGFGTSLSAIAECIYIAEIAPPKRRGLLVSLNEIGIASGLLLAYLISHVFINVDSGWRFMFGLSGVPALIQGFGMIFLPPSPRWLICQGRDSQAVSVIRTFTSHVSPEEEIIEMKQSLDLEHKFNICYLFGDHQNMRDRMFVGLGLVFFQQLTGQPSVLYYAPSIFENIGFQSHSAATLATVGIGVTKLVGTVITLALVDKSGRRRFLLSGSTLMTLTIALLYVITQCFPGKYHKELCTANNNEPLRTTPHPNLLSTLPPSFLNSPSYTRVKTPNTTLVPHSPLVTRPIPTHTPTTIKASRTSTISIQQYSKVKDTTRKTRDVHFHSSSLTTTTMFEESTFGSHRNASRDDHGETPPFVQYVAVLSLMAFAGAYSCSYGPVSWLVLSEIYPTEIKGRAFAATTVLNWGANLVVSFTMLDLIDSIGVSWTFFIYGVIGVLAVVFIYCYVPETKNRSLEEMNAMFSSRNAVNCSCRRCCLGTTLCCSCCHGNYSFIVSSRQDGDLLQDDDWEVT